MKHLLIREGNPSGLQTTELIRAAVNFSPTGLSIEEMRMRLRILDAVNVVLDRDPKDIALEDAWADALKRIVPQVKWSAIHPAIVQFADDVAAL